MQRNFVKIASDSGISRHGFAELILCPKVGIKMNRLLPSQRIIGQRNIGSHREPQFFKRLEVIGRLEPEQIPGFIAGDRILMVHEKIVTLNQQPCLF